MERNGSYASERDSVSNKAYGKDLLGWGAA